ncbi:MAG: hypothetical protein KDD38_04000 [Bdellovibrionales bacterium]|nr:hypothetical protein [Bdellovibrionales bacterium]
MARKSPKHLFIFALFTFVLMFLSQNAQARKSQLHVRTGLMTGSYNGTFQGTWEVSNAFDLEYELFVANDGAMLFRLMQGIDTPDSRPFYTFGGVGFRHYFRSGKGSFSEQEDSGMFISTRPRIRFYAGIDAGISQVIVKSFGPNVQSVANMLDININVGAIYQINDSFGLEGHLGYSGGYGISSTPTNGNTQRYFLGGTYFF